MRAAAWPISASTRAATGRAREGHVVWIGLLEPSDAELRVVQQQFGLNDLAIEDAAEAHQRPKLQRYGDSLFVVARTAEMIEDRIEFGETHLFVGKGFVVSVRHGPSASYKKVRAHCEASPGSLKRGESYIVYAILDFIVDNYLTVLERVQDEAEELENELLAERLNPGPGAAPLHPPPRPAAPALRRPPAGRGLRPAGAQRPLADGQRRWSCCSATSPIMSAASRRRLTRCARCSLSASRRACRPARRSRPTISRRLAAWAAILAVPTAVAGIYGMNFRHMPELESRERLLYRARLVLLTCFSLYVNFRRRDWL